MQSLETFRRAVQELYRRSRPYDDGRRPTQADLADAIGLHPTELSNRLNGNKRAKLTARDARAIVLTLAEWEAIRTHREANELLQLVGVGPLHRRPAGGTAAGYADCHCGSDEC